MVWICRTDAYFRNSDESLVSKPGEILHVDWGIVLKYVRFLKNVDSWF